MRIVGQENIASVFGVAPKTIVEWQEQGFPVAMRGGPGVPSEYETEACINWLVDRELKKVQAEKPQDRLARVQADKIEMENMERRGLLISAEQLARVSGMVSRAVEAGAESRMPVRRRRSAAQGPFSSRTLAESTSLPTTMRAAEAQTAPAHWATT